jgi:hypothetical protein
MTEYVYELRSDVPLDIGVGIGGAPAIYVQSWTPLVVRDVVKTVANAPQGPRCTLSLELKERVER